MQGTVSFSFSRAVVAGKLINDVTLEISDGFISRITRENVNRLDLTGYTAIPSFIDIHTHGMLGVDTSRLSQSSLGTWLNYLPKTGTLRVVPTLVSSDQKTTQEFLSIVNNGKKLQLREPFAEVIGARMEGPFISHAKKGAHNEKLLLNPTVENFKWITGEYSSFVRIIDLAPELEGAMDLIQYLRGRGILVSIGHSDADAMTTRNAILKGAREATHLFNAMRQIYHREPGIAGEILINDSINAEIINDPNHLSPGIIRLAVRAKGEDKIVGITDSLSATLMPDGEYELGSLVVKLEKGKCTIKGTDTIAGSVLTMDAAFRNFLDQGYSIEQTSKFLSTNPARVMSLDREGSIDIGMRGNMVVLNEGNQVTGVIKDGIYYDFRDQVG